MTDGKKTPGATKMSNHKKLRPYWTALILCVICGLFIGCDKNKNTATTTEKTYVTKTETMSSQLYFSGTIAPLSSVVVYSPVDGVIENLYFTFGREVKEGQDLVTIYSEKLEKDFLSAVGDYLKALDDYSDKNRTYEGSKELWKLKFISRNDYISDAEAREQSYFALRQAAQSIRDVVGKLGIKRDLKTINIKERNVVDQIIAKKHNKITVAATGNGVALFPKKSGDGSSGELAIGAAVKETDPLVVIGDIHGLTVQVNVSEVDINQLELKQKATVSGPGFPGVELQGYVSNINLQATDSSSQPMFPVTITVSDLSAEEQQLIHIGMSTKVAITLEQPDQIVVPIAAVFQENGQSYVKVKDKKTGEVKQVAVQTGKTSLDSVSIVQGLEPGETIVYSD